jgi:hypothetical protein
MIVDTNDLAIPVRGTAIDEKLWKQFALSLGKWVTDIHLEFYTNRQGERDVAISYGLHDRPAPTAGEVFMNILAKQKVA